MALEATHIRFALDLKDKRGVRDLKKYLAGAVYPDSRYITGIDRVLTHPQDFLTSDFFKADDDFRKGWCIHLLCDQIQWEITREKIPEAFEGVRGQGSETWIKSSALKIIQDMDDVRRYDIQPHLLSLDYTENPNGEDLSLMSLYNSIFQRMYADPKSLSIEIECEMWREFGIGDELVAALKSKTEEYVRNEKIVDAVKQIYPEVLRQALRAF